ncbi:MAG: heparinase II/III family protein [Clostridia bacterium]|nr:heparinase II/III family protein [Clostridia bacterium]
MIYDAIKAYRSKVGKLLGRPAFFPKAGAPEWQTISQADRKDIEKLQTRYHGIPYPMRTLTGFLAFVETGSRKMDEDPYFLRRNKLCVSVLAACLGDEEAFRDVLDGIWCICEESSWVISAHNINPVPGAPTPKDKPVPDVTQPYIDLFSAQTGMILSLTSYLLSERLDEVSPLLRMRISHEIRRRILEPYMTHEDFWWMGVLRTDLCNWTPWIVSNVMMAACLEMDSSEALGSLLERSGLFLDRWLNVMPADGGCDEGAGYWNMAGGALLDCLELLAFVTDEQVTFWDEPLIRNILMFPEKAEIGNGWFLNFADCDARPYLSGERIQAAGEHLHDEVLTALGRRIRGSLEKELADVPHFSRVLRDLFHPVGQTADAPQKADVWFPDLEVRIVRHAGCTLAVKGGHNGENHNHNDVGSFMYYVDDEPAIVDAGNMTYTAKTFSSERYTIWNVRSVYHNLPVVAGFEQTAGREYAASQVKALPDGLCLQIEGAYDRAAPLESLMREAVLRSDGQLCLHDRIVFKTPADIEWVFMLREKPEPDGDGFVSGKIRMICPAGCRMRTEPIPVEDPRMQKSFPGTLYRTVLSRNVKDTVDMEFIVGRA